MEPNVFIPHLPTRQNPVNGDWVPTISLNPAAELGDIQIICDHPSDAAPENVRETTDRIWDALESSAPGDFIVMAGDPVLCAVAIHVMLFVHDQARVLRWNRVTRSYDLLELGEAS